jgi:molecular chaperone Hsp33
MKDQIIKFLAYNGKISVVCCSTTNLVEEARKLHDLSPLSTAAMGRVLTITALIGSEMKNKTDKLTILIFFPFLFFLSIIYFELFLKFLLILLY